MRLAVLYVAAGSVLFTIASGRLPALVQPQGAAQLALFAGATYFIIWGVRAVFEQLRSDCPRVAGRTVWHLLLHVIAAATLVTLAVGVDEQELHTRSWGPTLLIGLGFLALSVALAVLFPSTERRQDRVFESGPTRATVSDDL
jgi:hypothetical protein